MFKKVSVTFLLLAIFINYAYSMERNSMTDEFIAEGLVWARISVNAFECEMSIDNPDFDKMCKESEYARKVYIGFLKKNCPQAFQPAINFIKTLCSSGFFVQFPVDENKLNGETFLWHAADICAAVLQNDEAKKCMITMLNKTINDHVICHRLILNICAAVVLSSVEDAKCFLENWIQGLLKRLETEKKLGRRHPHDIKTLFKAFNKQGLLKFGDVEKAKEILSSQKS